MRRFPANDLPRDATPLYRNLQRRGIVQPYENRSTRFRLQHRRDRHDKRLALRRRTERRRQSRIAVIGIPTEGNLVGNLTIARDDFSATWAAEIMRQLRAGRRSRALQSAEAV